MAIPLERLEGKYEILEKLREGGMGAIYKVRHRLLGEVRAVKVMRPQLQGQGDLQDRFLAEARAATRLSHPHLARIFDCTVDEDGVAYLVMEYIGGVTLAELLARAAPVPLPLTLEIARQGLRALGHLHAHQVAHRDVSPDNLMLTRDVDGRPLVKLIDLGIAKAIEGDGPLTGAGVFLGKFRYAAPETFEEPKPEDRRPGDLYSFALVLYELLTGVFPVSGDSPSSLIAGHLFRPPLDFAASDPHGRVPGEVRRAVLRGLAKSPEARFADAAAFAGALPAAGEMDLASPEVHRVLKLTEAGDREPAPPAPGSTQARLDSSFRPEPTPAPGPVEVAHGAAAEPPGTAVTETDETRILRPDADAAPPDGSVETDATIRIAATAPRMRDLLVQAQRASRDGDDTAALENLEEALAVDPGDAEVRALYAETRRAVRRREIEGRREQAVAARVDEISRLLAGDRLDDAEGALAEAGESFGRDPRWSQLRAALATRRLELDQARTLRADDFVEQARGLAQVEDFPEAAELLRAALELVPGHPPARALLASVEACLEVHEQEARDAGEVERTITGIRLALDAGRPADALEDLHRAAERFGDHEGLRELRYEAAQAQLEPAAGSESTTILRAPELPADDRPTLEKTLGSIRALRDQGRAGAALKELNVAFQEYGPQPVLKTLRHELGEALLARDAEEEETASRMFEIVGEPEAPAAGPPAPEPASPALHQATLRTTSPAAPPPERPEPPGAQSHRGLVAGALVLVAVFAGLAWVLSRDQRIAGPAAPPAEGPAAAALSPGLVAIDAVPWAEIVRLEQPGSEEPPPVPPARFTPVILRLPPAEYAITLRYPPSGEEETLTVRVASDVRTDHRLNFGEPLDGEQYFRRVGW